MSWVNSYNYEEYDGWILENAIPVLLLSPIIEFFLVPHKYKFRDLLCSYSTAIFMLMSTHFNKLPLKWFGNFISNHKTLEISDENLPLFSLTNLILFLLTDFFYYIFHFLSHKYNVLWTAHSVHHSSEYYNLGTALRQGAFQSFFANILMRLPLLFLGFPIGLTLFHSDVNLVGQFWIHTECIGDLGPLEYILNTPVQHSRHHSRVPGECNSNYGGVLSIFDQIFGTFNLNPSKRFGLCDPTLSFNPILESFRHFKVMFQAWKKRKTWREKLKVFGSSGRFVTVKNLKMNVEHRLKSTETKYEKVYMSIHFIVLIIEYLHFALFISGKKEMTLDVNFLIAFAYICCTMISTTTLFLTNCCFQDHWFFIEILRLLYYVCGICGFLSNKYLLFNLISKYNFLFAFLFISTINLVLPFFQSTKIENGHTQ